MLLKLKQFIKGIDTSSLLPLAAFTTIVGLVFYPLRRLSDTAALPLGMLASSFCVFVIGCYISEIFKTKISPKGWKYIAIVAILFALHIFIDDGIYSWCYAPPLSILWYPWSYVKLTSVNPFFLCLGMIVNHYSDGVFDRPCLFRAGGSMKLDIFIVLLSLFTFVALMYGICVHAFFEEMSVQTAWIVRYVVRIICFPIWSILMIFIYRCLSSLTIISFAQKYPKVFIVIAWFAPIAILNVLKINLPVYSVYELLYYPLPAVVIIIYIALVFSLLRMICSVKK